jgi:hypothetical protein
MLISQGLQLGHQTELTIEKFFFQFKTKLLFLGQPGQRVLIATENV